MQINKNQRAQSLLEISIFGGILLVFITALLSYGVRNNYYQQITQQAFRKALYFASLFRQASYILIDDRYIPDPTKSFAQGFFMPQGSSASIIRNYQMQEWPANETIEALPALAMDIKGTVCLGSGGPVGGADCRTCGNDLTCLQTCQRSPPGTPPPCFYLMSGYRNIDIGTTDPCEKRAKWEKYALIYGGSNTAGYNASGGRFSNFQDINWDNLDHIQVVDACEGEILNYDLCSRQCQMITDVSSCIAYCNTLSGDICAQKCSANIEIPWYCSLLGSLFNDTVNNLNVMGLQSNKNETLDVNATFNKKETTTDITTVSTFQQGYVNKRLVIFRPYGNRSGIVVASEAPSTDVRGYQRTLITDW